MCFDWQKIALYLASRLLSSFLPRRKRRALRRHYNWLYGRIMVGWARGMYQQAHAFELSKESLRQIVFGSSHAYYGYLPNDGEFLLATGSQDLYTSYELYCRVSELRSLKRVVLFVSVFRLAFRPNVPSIAKCASTFGIIGPFPIAFMTRRTTRIVFGNCRNWNRRSWMWRRQGIGAVAITAFSWGRD